MASPGLSLFLMPSRPAISIAAKPRYGLHSGAGKRSSTRLGFGVDRKSTRLHSRPTEIYPLSLHDALPILFLMPSRPAISIAAKPRYGLHSGSGKRTSTRLAFGLVVNGMRHDAERLRAE